MALIAFWLVSIENRSILFRRYFPSNGTKSSDGKMIAMLTMKEEGQFVSGLMGSLGMDNPQSNSSNQSTNSDGLEYSFSFDCTQINQLPALGFHLKGFRLWPIIVLEHKGILFCGLPVLNNSSTNLIDHIGVSLAVATLQTLINYFAQDNKLYLLEEYFTKNLPFGSHVTNPYENDDESMMIIKQSKSNVNKISSSTVSLSSTISTSSITSSSSSSSSKHELVLTIRITEFISSTLPATEMIHGTVNISNNLILPGNPVLTYKIANLHDLNVILSPHCWLNNGFGNFSSPSMNSSSSSSSSSPASINSSGFSCICSKLNSKALRYFHYKCNSGLITEPFLTYSYLVTRATETSHYLDLTITIKGGHSMRFHSFRINFPGLTQKMISRLANCQPSQGQLHADQQNGFYWIVGTKIPKTGRIRLTADINNCFSLPSTDQLLDGSANFRVDNYVHGFPRPRTDSFTVSDNLYSINFKLTPQLTLTTFDYRLIPTFS